MARPLGSMATTILTIGVAVFVLLGLLYVLGVWQITVTVEPVMYEDITPPLHLMIERGADVTEIDAFLSEDSAAINGRNRNGSTPLHVAVWRERVDIVRVLLDHGADPNAQIGGSFVPLQGYTSLHAGVLTNNLPIVEALLDAGARTDVMGDDGMTPVELAREMGHAQLVELLEARAAK